MYQLIDRRLHGRQQLVQAFDVLSGIQAPALNAEELQHFYQLPPDYASTGHFEAYEQLTAEGRAFGDQRDLELAKQILPQLEAIARSALNLNNRHDNDDCREGIRLIAELRVPQ